MVVVDAQFIEPYTVDLAVQRKPAVANLNGNFTIIDVSGNMMFKIKDTLFSFHDRHILYDANEKPVLTFKKKNMSAHDRWNVYWGESNNDQQIIFSTVSNHMIQFKTHVKVFLANKTSGTDDCDFTIKGKWSKKNCKIYMGDSSTIIAQMDKMQPPANNDKFMVTISPKVDYAFVVALIAIIDAMETQSTTAGNAVTAGGVEGATGSIVENIITGLFS
ncbi:hypothetical protein E3N88_35487 [Mikania micrantha]|uniref:Tubby C-terminal domain-containing protein n=1 Tax=Mikania micrantha TaxID=192012 RepID=A0A5N6M161_9ASTR|nr:hypothetical protein E3N88_35487 [Mikania micrantha]